jgi:hypothetical protein
MSSERDESGTTNASGEIASLKRQVRQLQLCLLAMVAVGAVAASGAASPGTLRANRLILADASGRSRIVLDAADRSGPAMRFRDASGADRLLVGDEPDPVVAGKVYPRVAPAWGMLIFNLHGDERGGMSYLDNGRSIVSLDRANGEGVYMTVNEKSGFAGLVGNYEGRRVGDYAEAFRLGTLEGRVFAQASNRDGSPAGALVGGTHGRLQRTDVVQK